MLEVVGVVMFGVDVLREIVGDGRCKEALMSRCGRFGFDC